MNDNFLFKHIGQMPAIKCKVYGSVYAIKYLTLKVRVQVRRGKKREIKLNVMPIPVNHSQPFKVKIRPQTG